MALWATTDYEKGSRSVAPRGRWIHAGDPDDVGESSDATGTHCHSSSSPGGPPPSSVMKTAAHFQKRQEDVGRGALPCCAAGMGGYPWGRPMQATRRGTGPCPTGPARGERTLSTQHSALARDV